MLCHIRSVELGGELAGPFEMLAQAGNLFGGEALNARSVPVGRALELRERFLLRQDSDVACVSEIEVVSREFGQHAESRAKVDAHLRRQCHTYARGELLQVRIDGNAVTKRRFGESPHRR